MGNNNGCGVLAVLILVFVIFGAGYLLAAGDQIEINNRIADAAIEQAVRANATLVPQATQAAELRVQLAAAEDARRSAEKALAEANAAHASAENDLAAAQAALAKSEGDLAAMRAETQRLASESAARQTEAIRLQSHIAELEGRLAAQQDPLSIPATGGEQEQSVPFHKKPVASWLLPGIGMLLFGAVAVDAAFHARRGRNMQPAARYTSDITFVKMTRDEARAYARWRTQRQAQS